MHNKDSVNHSGTFIDDRLIFLRDSAWLFTYDAWLISL